MRLKSKANRIHIGQPRLSSANYTCTIISSYARGLTVNLYPPLRSCIPQMSRGSVSSKSSSDYRRPLSERAGTDPRTPTSKLRTPNHQLPVPNQLSRLPRQDPKLQCRRVERSPASPTVYQQAGKKRFIQRAQGFNGNTVVSRIICTFD